MNLNIIINLLLLFYHLYINKPVPGHLGISFAFGAFTVAPWHAKSSYYYGAT